MFVLYCLGLLVIVFVVCVCFCIDFLVWFTCGCYVTDGLVFWGFIIVEAYNVVN